MSVDLLEVDDPELGRLRVPEGGSTVLLGPSGAGKSRWLARLLGIARATGGGNLRWAGHPVTTEQLRTHVGWVPQTDAVFLSGTVWENVRTPPGRRPRPDDRTALDVLDLLGLANRRRDPCSALGRGERRRVGLARALAARAELLVVDDPLDPTVTSWWADVLRQAPGGGPRGVLTASGLADAHARSHDRVALVADCRVIAEGAWPDLLQSMDPDVRGVLTWTRQT